VTRCSECDGLVTSEVEVESDEFFVLRVEADEGASGVERMTAFSILPPDARMTCSRF
jgi:hypothetical protein